MNALGALRPYRPLLYILAVIGLFGINGVFLYNALLRPDVMAAATENPISLVFQIEAFLMVGFIAWLMALYGFKRPGWLAFVVLSIAGSPRVQRTLVSADAYAEATGGRWIGGLAKSIARALPSGRFRRLHVAPF